MDYISANQSLDSVPSRWAPSVFVPSLTESSTTNPRVYYFACKLCPRAFETSVRRGLAEIMTTRTLSSVTMLMTRSGRLIVAFLGEQKPRPAY